MGTVMEKYYLNGVQINKQTLTKYIKWERLLSAVKNGCNTRDDLVQRLGLYARDNMSRLKAEDLCVTVGRGAHSYYEITAKGEQLIETIKQYEREKKNEKI